MTRYSYNLQLADFDHKQVDDRGVTAPRDIVSAFDAFDWPGQIEEANRLQNISPTFSVLDNESDRLLWLSGVGEPSEYYFIIGYSYQGEISSMFGFKRTRGTINAPTKDLSLDDARRAVELFVDGDHDRLYQHVT